MWARRFEDRRRSEERRWRRSYGPAKRRHASFAEVIARREYASVHHQLDAPVVEGPAEELMRLGDRLRSPRIGEEEKKQILVMLAHRRGPSAQRLLNAYAARPDRGLEWFARLAVEEARQVEANGCCQMTRQAPCPCGSAQKLKDCCGRAL